MRMSELKQIHDEVSRGVAGSSSGDSLATPASPRARCWRSKSRKAVSRSEVMYHDDGNIMPVLRTVVRCVMVRVRLVLRRMNPPPANHSRSRHNVPPPTNESIMFAHLRPQACAQACWSNFGAALWEATTGITSPETQMEYARAVAFTSSASGSSKVPKTMSSNFGESTVGSFSTSTVSGTFRHAGMGSSTGVPLSSISSQSPLYNMAVPGGATFVAAASQLGSASTLPRRGAIDLPHWYINPESSHTSPKPDPVFDFKSLKVNDHTTQFSSSYWASKLGISSARFRRKPKARTSPLLGDPMTQRYEYRSPL